jgi:hypothetical protein
LRLVKFKSWNVTKITRRCTSWRYWYVHPPTNSWWSSIVSSMSSSINIGIRRRRWSWRRFCLFFFKKNENYLFIYLNTKKMKWGVNSRELSVFFFFLSKQRFQHVKHNKRVGQPSNKLTHNWRVALKVKTAREPLARTCHLTR